MWEALISGAVPTYLYGRSEPTQERLDRQQNSNSSLMESKFVLVGDNCVQA